MVVVDQFNERLNLGSLGGLLGTHVLSNLQWVSFNTNNNGMWEWVRLGTFIVRLDNNNLLTGETSTNDNSYKVSI